jgi:amidase
MRYRVFDPAMTIEPGETVIVETINHMTPIVRSEDDIHAHGTLEYQEREETGPIYVRGAVPGDALAVKIEKIEPVGLPHAHGGGPLSDIYPQKPLAFPIESGRCSLPGGLSVPLATMVGDIYTTPSTMYGSYYDHGGNMDFTEVKPGNVLYLPVFHEGGLLVLGDVHAFQGDGEIFMEGGETAAEVTITVDVNRDYQLKRPMVETEDVYIFLACREMLFDSIRLATEDAVDLTSQLFGVSKEDAYIYCSMAGSLRFGGCLCNKRATERDVLVGLSVPKDCRR